MALQVAAGMHPEGVQKSADVNADTYIGLEEAVYALLKASISIPGGDYTNSLDMNKSRQILYLKH